MKQAVCFFLLLSAVCASAQLPTDFRSEQIFLSTDRHEYMPGDTVEVEGRVACMSEQDLRPYSRYLYVELFNGADSVLVRQKLSCKGKGYFHARLVTDYEWPADVYYLRAYTRLMRNFSPESFPVQPVLIGKRFPDLSNGRGKGIRCVVAPSGGRLVAGSMQSVAVQLTDALTLPVEADLYLQDEKGDTLSTIRTSVSGLARLNFIPQPGARYFLVGNCDGESLRVELPETTSGIKIQGNLSGGRLSYEIFGGKVSDADYRLYLYDRKNGLSRLETVRQRAIVSLDKEPEVVTLFLTDNRLDIVSEYTVSGKYHLTGGLSAPDTLRTGDTLRYRLTSFPEDGRVMARVVADNDLLASHAEASLDFLSDYTSPLRFPYSLYVSDDAVERGNDLKTWLSTATFGRFLLKDVVEKDTAVYAYLPEQEMTFGGRIADRNRRAFAGGTLVAYHTGNDLVYDAPIDGDGRFRMAVDDFSEGESFFLQAVTAKGKPDFADIRVDDETYPAVVNRNPYYVPSPYYAGSEVSFGSGEMEYMADRNGMRHLRLPDVTVSARMRSDGPPEPTNKFYSMNFADREEIEKWNYRTVEDILKDMPGIIITKSVVTDDKGNIIPGVVNTSVTSTRGPSVLNASNSLPILLDGTRIEQDQYDFVLHMPTEEVETVELLRPWQTNAYTWGAVNGAILVKTRNYTDKADLSSKGTMYTPMGLSPSAGLSEEKAWIASEKGSYRLMVDVFTSSGVQSYEHRFVVE